MDNGRLGKGLDQLLGDEGQDGTPPDTDTLDDARLKQIPIEKIEPNPHQPREQFDPDELKGLVQSIQEEGVLQPVLVTPSDDKFTLAAGERRFRAAREAGLEQIPAVVHELNDQRMLEIALVENVQRENLNPIEKARALDRLFTTFDLDLDQIASITGTSPSAISNTRRLLQLDEDLQELITDGALSSGHGRALLALEHPEQQRNAAEKIIRNDLSVRNTEKLINDMTSTDDPTPSNPSPDDTLPPELEAIQEKLEEHVGTRVTIKNNKNGGAIRIKYGSDDELNAILERLGL